MTDKLEPCPACGALPCDWVDNPHRAPQPTGEVSTADRDAVNRAERFAKGPHCTCDDHDDIMVAVRLARRAASTAQAQAEIARLKAQVEELEAERRCLISHGTMGETDGEGMTLNDACVAISAARNRLYVARQETSKAQH